MEEEVVVAVDRGDEPTRGDDVVNCLHVKFQYDIGCQRENSTHRVHPNQNIAKEHGEEDPASPGIGVQAIEEVCSERRRERHGGRKLIERHLPTIVPT